MSPDLELALSLADEADAITLPRFRAADLHVPRPSKGNYPVKILFASQIGTAPPTFALKINAVGDLHFSYLRFLENRIREAFGFEGTPIRLKVRGRRRTVRS